MSYSIPDLTASDPSYRIVNSKSRIITANQKLYLNDAVYSDTLTVTLEGTLNVVLSRGVDWAVDEEDVDYTLMGRLQRLDETFDKTIITAIRVTKPFISPYNINLDYQRVYPVEMQYIQNNPNDNIEFTPDVLESMIRSIINLEMATAPIQNIQAVTDKKPLMLEPDPTKSLSENIIKDERWKVDVPNNVCVIHPVAGAFYKDSLKIFYPISNSFLKEGEDYIVTGLDYYKTKHTTNESGVYGFVVIIKSIVGEVTASYHAYGGQPTIYDIRQLYETLTNIRKYVTDSQILTATTLGSADSFVNLVSRINALEKEMRRLATQGRPTYGEDNKSLLMKISSVDNKFHWWTIGSLYKVAGSDTVFTSDISHLQIQTLYSKFLIDMYISMDITNPYEKFRVNTNTSITPTCYIPFENDSGLDDLIRPQLRIIWNTNTIESSGILLQIGLRLKGLSEETIAIADLSGPECCFILESEKDEAQLPNDDIIQLPSGNSIWDEINPDSRYASQLIPLKDGNLVWAGLTVLNRPLSGFRNIELEHFLEDEVNIGCLKTVKFLLEEDSSNRFCVEFPLTYSNGILSGASSFTYGDKPASMIFRAMRDYETEKIKMEVGVDVTAGLASNPLYLRYVIVNS